MNWKHSLILIVIVLVLLSVYVMIASAPVSAPGDPATSTPTPEETPETMEITLYVYDPSRDLDAGGNVLCSNAGIVPVSRSIPQTPTPLGAALELLFAGSLTIEERARGLTTEFPLEEVVLESVDIENGTAVISINDPENSTSGGACRTNIMSMQIKRTATQFPTVTDVRFEPEEVFQP